MRHYQITLYQMQQFKNHNYKVVEPAEDWRDSVIEKDQITAKFTIREFEDNIERMNKTIRELEAKFKHEKVVVNNIEHHHPFVKDMSEQDQYTVWMYREAKEVVKQFEPRIEEFKKALQEEIQQMTYVKRLLKDDLNGLKDAEVIEKKDGE